jgi:hypothetical protein
LEIVSTNSKIEKPHHIIHTALHTKVLFPLLHISNITQGFALVKELILLNGIGAFNALFKSLYPLMQI